MTTPPDNVDLHRMIWSPDDIDNGQLLTSAFPRSDLSKSDRYISVDRTDIFDENAVKQIVAIQASKSDGTEIIRDEAHSALLACGAVRRLADTNQKRPFDVRSEKLADNPAHCGIYNVSGERGKSYVNELRSMLVSVVHEVLALSDFLKRR